MGSFSAALKCKLHLLICLTLIGTEGMAAGGVNRVLTLRAVNTDLVASLSEQIDWSVGQTYRSVWEMMEIDHIC